MSDQENKNSFSSLILGIIIGATITYLFTNKRGQKIKDRLLAEGRKLLEELGQEAQIEEEVEEAKEEIPEHITQIQKKGRRFFFHRSQRTES